MDLEVKATDMLEKLGSFEKQTFGLNPFTELVYNNKSTQDCQLYPQLLPYPRACCYREEASQNIHNDECVRSSLCS